MSGLKLSILYNVLTISYHKAIIGTRSVRFNVQGKDVEFHSRVGSLDEPRTVHSITVTVRPARGEEKHGCISCPKEATTSTCRIESNIFDTALIEKMLALFHLKATALYWKEATSWNHFSEKSMNIVFNPLIRRAAISVIDLWCKKKMHCVLHFHHNFAI